jgi:hypothetical protein
VPFMRAPPGPDECRALLIDGGASTSADLGYNPGWATSARAGAHGSRPRVQGGNLRHTAAVYRRILDGHPEVGRAVGRARQGVNAEAARQSTLTLWCPLQWPPGYDAAARCLVHPTYA